MSAFEFSNLSRLGRLAVPSVPGLNQLPGVKKIPSSEFAPITVTSAPAAIDAAHVARYAEVCGFPRKDALPLTYPHLAAFTQHMELMARPEYPWPAMGGVHVENTIVQQRAIGFDEVLTSSVTVQNPRSHPKGRLIDFVSTVTSDGEEVWTALSTYLIRGRGEESNRRSLGLGDAPVGTTEWTIPADTGRRYGLVSGDINPIHLYPVTAKALGFKRHLVHGMWSKARCLASLENRLPDAVRVEASFKKPVFLPATVAFGMETSGNELRFGLTSPKDGSPHLVARATPL